MILTIALAIATLGPAPDAPVAVPVDCVRKIEPLPKKGTVVPKHSPKPISGTYRPKQIKRLFKTDPVVEEDCGEGVLPAAPSVALEPIYDLPISLQPVDVPLPVVPGVAEEQPPCECFGGESGLPIYLAGPVPLLAYPVVPVPLAPVPEEPAWALLIGSVIASRLWFAKRSARSDQQTTIRGGQ